MTELGAVGLCGHVTERCVCIRVEGHDGPCACDCGGVISKTGDVYAFPAHQGMLTPETIEAYVATKTTTANPMMALSALLGFPFSDDEDDDDE